MDRELYEALTALGRAGFLIHSYQLDRDNRPDIVAGVLNRGAWADVVILHGETRAYALRTPRGEGRDVLYPTEVSWDCAAKPARAITALLALPAPGPHGTRTVLYPPQSGLCLPPEQRSPKLTIRTRATA
jgi:hypothetical protein